jgi:signal transduction histidine kinase
VKPRANAPETKAGEPADPNAPSVAELERKIAELDARALELERLAAARGVKLSCANIALSRAKIAFDEAAARREAMVQEVSHDLRTPLTSIKGAAQNLLDGIAGPLDDGTREYVELMRDQADRLIGVVSWLVDAMSISAEPMELSAAEVDLSLLAKEVVRTLLPVARERGIALEVSAPAQAIALADERRMREVVENLLGNALKFTSAGGSVTVRVASDDDTVCIRVVDTGIGMSPEEANRVFDRYYYRRNDTRGGRGLGLAISREVVRVHGGEITLKSRAGEGSEFIVVLPKRSLPTAGES